MTLEVGDKFKWFNEDIIYTIVEMDLNRAYGQYLVEWWSHGIWGVYDKRIMWDGDVIGMNEKLSDGTVLLVYKANKIGPIGSIKKLIF